MPQELKALRLLTFQLATDLLEMPDRRLVVQSLAATAANQCTDLQHGGVVPAAKELLNLLLNKLSTADGARIRVRHRSVLLIRQSVHRAGSGR
jgi:hypothetical protein